MATSPTTSPKATLPTEESMVTFENSKTSDGISPTSRPGTGEVRPEPSQQSSKGDGVESEPSSPSKEASTSGGSALGSAINMRMSLSSKAKNVKRKTKLNKLTKESERPKMEGVYSGEKIDELRHGLGTLVFPNGDKYVGQFHQGMRHGRGELTCAPKRTVVTAAAATAAATGGNPPCQRYAGQWMLSKRHGRGVETWPNGDKYDGEYKMDLFDGVGQLKTRSGWYNGEFKAGRRHGKGTMEYHQGKGNAVYDGEWAEGVFCGFGTYTWPDNRRYEGAWKDSLRHGVGVMHDPNGEKHEGEFYRGQKHGPGTFRATNGQCRDGEWFYDERKRWTGKEYFGRKPQKKR